MKHWCQKQKLNGWKCFLANLIAGFFIASICLDVAIGAEHRSFLPISSGKQSKLNSRGQFLIEADEITYDQKSEVITALGHVQIAHIGWVIMAERLTYNRTNDLVIATGNTAMISPSGDVVYGDYIELTGDMRDAIIKNFRSLLVDNTRIASVSAERINGNRKVMIKGVFSPCEPCKTDPARPPIWQLKGERIVHDERDRAFVYHHATLEAFGIPIFYTPYLTYPDSTVKRKSGFLVPTSGYSSRLGFIYSQPYYGVIDNSSDFTLEPRIMSKEGEFLGGEYRKRLVDGSLRVIGSVVSGRKLGDNGNFIVNRKILRGNFAIDGLYNFNDNWRTGVTSGWQSDPTYSSRFRLSQVLATPDRYGIPNQLTNNAYLEGFLKRDYAAVEAFYFQPFVADQPVSRIAIVHPFAQYNFFGPTDSLGGRYEFDMNYFSLSRRHGGNSNRLSITSSYRLPYIDPIGEIWTVTTSVQSDAYAINNRRYDQEGTSNLNGSKGRVAPKLRFDWRYPLIKTTDSTSYIIEPRADIVVAPLSGNSVKIPNEDSHGFEFSDLNLFSDRRLGGYDLVDTGQRVDYGIASSAYTKSGFGGGVFVGQSYQMQKNPIYLQDSGLDTRLSDYVGRVSIAPVNWFSTTYRFRLNQTNLNPKRQEIALNFAQWGGYFNANFIQYNLPNKLVTTNNWSSDHPQQIKLAVSAPIHKYYTLRGSLTRDLALNKPLIDQLSLIYKDECFGIALDYERTYKTYYGIKPGSTFLVRIGLKYLGDIGG